MSDVGRVVLVGSVAVDLVARAERLPGPGETVTGATFEVHHGGKGANAAVAAARAGARVAFIGAVGDDEHGRAARAALLAEGIDVDGLTTIPDLPTAVALIHVGAGGENRIVVASGANTAIDPDRVRAALQSLARDDVVLTNLEIPDGPVAAAAESARTAGARFLLVPAPVRPLPAAVIAANPIVIANRSEAATLAGTRDPSAAARVLGARTEAPAIVSLGADGALGLDGERLWTVPAPVVEAVDTTGAGDTLAGVLAAALANGTGLGEALEQGVLAASASVSGSGARSWRADRTERGGS